MRGWNLMVVVAGLSLFLVPPGLAGRGDDNAIGPDTQRTLEIVGFSDDGRNVGLKTSDEEGRSSFEFHDVKKATLKGSISFLEGQDKKGMRKLKKKGITAEPLGAENANGIILMSAQKGSSLFIYGMKGENCTKKLAEIKLTKVKESKRTEQPEAFAKQLTWGPRGKFVAVIYHEKYKKTHAWEGDKLFGFKFKAYKLNCSPKTE